MDSPTIDKLREIPRVRQHGARHRRWFTCESVDLYLWEGEAGLEAFEICYGKPRAEHSLVWDIERGLQHARIDDGESTPFEQASPIAVANGRFDPTEIALALERVAADVEPRVLRHLLRVLHLGH